MQGLMQIITMHVPQKTLSSVVNYRKSDAVATEFFVVPSPRQNPSK